MKTVVRAFSKAWRRLCFRKAIPISLLIMIVAVQGGALDSGNGCDQLTTELAGLPSFGGTVDVTGFGNSTCNKTISISVPAKILFGGATWTFNGNPGISVNSPKVIIECLQSSEGDIYGVVPPNLQSGGPYPLIADTNPSGHGTDGFTIESCYLDGKGIGAFGLFFPYGNAGQIYKTITRGFTSAGQFILGGQWIAYANSSALNGGDGVVWGYDGEIDGNPQYVVNGGSGLHNVIGGSVLTSIATYHNKLHGIYLDGRTVGDWTNSTTFLSPSFIIPTSGNSGKYVFFTQSVGTTGTVRPTFCQTPGCTFTDGKVTWINAGTAMGYGLNSIFNKVFPWTSINSPTCADTGFGEPDGFVGDNIRVEGSAEYPVIFTAINGPVCHQSEGDDYNANGIHLLNVNYATVSNYGWLGSGYSNNVGGAGLLVESSKGVIVSGMASWFSYSNAIRLVHSSLSTFSGIVAVNTGLASTPIEETYAISIDKNSVINTVDSLSVRDDRTPPYSRGLYDAGSGTILSNYRVSNVVDRQITLRSGRPLRPTMPAQDTGSRQLGTHPLGPVGMVYAPIAPGSIGATFGSLPQMIGNEPDPSLGREDSSSDTTTTDGDSVVHTPGANATGKAGVSKTITPRNAKVSAD